MGEPDNKTVKIQDEVIDIPDHRDEDDVHAEVCIHPGRHREDSGFSNGEEDDAQHRLSELEDKLYRRCFDKVRLYFWFLFTPIFLFQLLLTFKVGWFERRRQFRLEQIRLEQPPMKQHRCFLPNRWPWRGCVAAWRACHSGRSMEP